MTGPSAYRLAALALEATQAAADAHQAATDAQAALASFQTLVDSALAQLNGVAVNAGAALTESVNDRALLHTQLDALTVRVTALESPPPPPPP